MTWHKQKKQINMNYENNALYSVLHTGENGNEYKQQVDGVFISSDDEIISFFRPTIGDHFVVKMHGLNINTELVYNGERLNVLKVEKICY